MTAAPDRTPSRPARLCCSLSPTCREAVTLAYFGGYSQTEVARILGLPVGTVTDEHPGRAGRPPRRDGCGVMSDLHGAAGSYAVDALDPVERAEFESHLADCPSCRSEVSEFAESLAELAPLAAVAPPAALRDSVLAAVADLRQAGPQRAPRSADRASQGGDEDAEVAPRRALLASVTELRPLEPHEVAPLEEHPSVVPDMPWLGVAAALSEDMGRRSRWRDRVLGGLLAAALVAALVLGGWVYVSQQQLQTQTTQAQQETDAADRSGRGDPRLQRERVTGLVRGVQANATRRCSSPRIFLIRAANSIYQLWTVKDGTATSAGVVREGGDVRRVAHRAGERFRRRLRSPSSRRRWGRRRRRISCPRSPSLSPVQSAQPSPAACSRCWSLYAARRRACSTGAPAATASRRVPTEAL